MGDPPPGCFLDPIFRFISIVTWIAVGTVVLLIVAFVWLLNE
jgi:hypothetical protein